MNLKYTVLTIIITVFLFISCGNDPVNTNEDEKYADFDISRSVIPKRIQFGIDKPYHYKLFFDSNYKSDEGFLPVAFFTLEGDTVYMPVYDDGISDDSLKNDLAAANNVWSGGINSYDFPKEGNWILTIRPEVNLNLIISCDPVPGIIVNSNTTPEITQIIGLADGDSLRSGFESFPINVSILDPDNDASGYNDNQTLQLFIFNRYSEKSYSYLRPDPIGDIIIPADSSYSAGLKSGRYTFRFSATDLYGESDTLSVVNVEIENKAPVITSVSHPDSVDTSSDGVLWIKADINDQQGNLSYQDIDRVEIFINSSPYFLLDDGNYLLSGDETENDGTYTIGFSYNAGTAGVFNFSVTAYDKGGNISQVYVSDIVLVSDKDKRSADENKFIYINPFN